jgi:GntR family transcriptional regulator, transcriptional repressor for pyruvate dehydrogenase complex
MSTMALSTDAINAIKAMILSGELKPGDRLPPEQELAGILGLSRNMLREAVKALELVRLLEVRRGDGTYVSSLEPSALLEALTFVVDLHNDASVLEILEVRSILEPYATALAAQNRTTADLDRMEAQLSLVDEDSTIDELVAADITFHGDIYTASGNSYLAGLLSALSGETLRARLWRLTTEESNVSRTLAEHTLIWQAISRGEVELARATAYMHVAATEAWLRRAAE